MSQETLDLGDVAEDPTFSVERAHHAGERRPAARVSRAGVGAGRGAEPEALPERPHLLLPGREGRRPRRPRAGPARLPCCSATTAPRSPARSRRCRAPSSATTSRCASAAGSVSYQGKLQLVMSAIDPVFTVGGIAANRERVLARARGRRPARSQRPARARSGPAAGGPDHEPRQRRLPRLRARARGQRLRVAGGCRRRAGAGRRRVAPHRVGAPRARPPPGRRRRPRARRRLPRRPRPVRHRAGGAGDRRRCRCPVLTGVGHEVDRSVADEVAHTACKTPTACAQILVNQVRVVRAEPRPRRATSGVACAVACGARGT